MPLAFYYIFANGYLTEVGMKNATGWMTLGQFSEIFFMLALPFFTKRFGIKKVLLLGLITAAIRYGFLFTAARKNISPMPCCFLAFCCTASVTTSTMLRPISMSIKSACAYAYCRSGVDHPLLSGVWQPAGLPSRRRDDGKMFAYKEPVNGLTFNWAGMWTFGAVMIAVIAVLFMIFFRESDKEITAIKVDDRDIALTQGKLNES